jgi:hypothetical protein
MSNHYTVLASYKRDGFDVIVDKTWDDTRIADCFDDTCYDIASMERRVDSGQLDWFLLRARVLLKGHELGSSYLGGCLYEDARECLEDGIAEDVIFEAMNRARGEAKILQAALQNVVDAA